MLRKFLDKIHKRGMPLNQIDVEGIQKMDQAWATLDVEGGTVDWTAGRPTIIAPVSGSSSSRMPFDIRANATTGKVEVYHTSDGINQSDMAWLNGSMLDAYFSINQDVTENGFVGITNLPTSGNTITVTFYLRKKSLSANADLTSSDAISWIVAANQPSPNEAWLKYRVIGEVENDGGTYIVRQYIRGAQVINAQFTDTDSREQIGATYDLYDTRSIDTQASGGAASLTLYRFKAGTSPNSTEFSDVWFLVREIVSGVTQLAYYDGTNFQNKIQALIDTSINDGLLPIQHDSGDISGVASIGTSNSGINYHLSDFYIDTTDPDNPKLDLSQDDYADQYVLLDGDATRNAMSGVIGASDNTVSLDPDNRKLLGLWSNENGANAIQFANPSTGNAATAYGNMEVLTGVFKHEGNAGVTGDGFSGGIKVDATTSTASSIENAELYT